MKKFKNKKLASAMLAATALLGGNSAPKTLANDKNNMATQNLKVENTKSKYTTAQWAIFGTLGALITASGIGYFIYDSKKQVKENQNIPSNSNSNFEGSKKSYENHANYTSSYEEERSYEYEWKLYCNYSDRYSYQEFESLFGDAIRQAKKNNNEHIFQVIAERDYELFEAGRDKTRGIVYKKFMSELQKQINNNKSRQKFIKDINEIFKNKWEDIIPHVKEVKIHGSEFNEAKDRYDEFKNAEEAKQKLKIDGLYSQAARVCYETFYAYINKVELNDEFELNFEGDNTLMVKSPHSTFPDYKITLNYEKKQLKLFTEIKGNDRKYKDQDFVIIDVSSFNFSN